jgi:hypothetical protein
VLHRRLRRLPRRSISGPSLGGIIPSGPAGVKRRGGDATLPVSVGAGRGFDPLAGPRPTAATGLDAHLSGGARVAEVILGVHVDLDVLLTWLEVHTADAARETLSVDGGTLTLEPSLNWVSADDEPFVATVDGRYRAAAKTRARRVSGVLILRFTTLGWHYVEVRIDPIWPAAVPYTVSLVGAIALRWRLKLLNLPQGEHSGEESDTTVPAPANRGDTLDQPVQPPAGPRVPARPKDLVRWRATWQKVRAQWQQGKGYTAISQWLEAAHPELRCSPETLADIVQAGHAGRLDI